MGEGLEHSGWILIGVREAFQARGVGARLLKTLIGAATVVFGLRRVQLTVFGDNDPAIKLYRRFGFEIEGRHRDFIRRGDGFVDGYTMARLNERRARAGLTRRNLPFRRSISSSSNFCRASVADTAGPLGPRIEKRQSGHWFADESARRNERRPRR